MPWPAGKKLTEHKFSILIVIVVVVCCPQKLNGAEVFLICSIFISFLLPSHLFVQPQAVHPVGPDPSIDSALRQLYHKTAYQDLLLTVTEMCAKESYLRCIKVFIDWLQSNPAVIATYGVILTLFSDSSCHFKIIFVSDHNVNYA